MTADLPGVQQPTPTPTPERKSDRPQEPDRRNRSGTPWQTYTALLRELDRIRLAEEQRTASSRESSQLMSTRAQELTAVVLEQQGQLPLLARLLRLSSPRLAPLAPRPAAPAPDDEQPDPAEQLRLAAEGLAGVAALGERAQQRGRRAALLPGWPVGLRNALLYAGLVVVLQALTFVFGPRENGFVVLFGVPTGAFLTGLVVISLFGGVRIRPEPARRFGQPVPPDPDRRSVRAGLLICFLAAPVLGLAVVAVGVLRR